MSDAEGLGPQPDPTLRRVTIRKTHPNLYYSITLFGCVYVALALNFFLTHPTFTPLGIPKNVIGAIFLTLGVAKLVCLNVIKVLRLVRLVMAYEIGFVCFWAIVNTQQFWAHKASLQLPIVYLAISLLEFPLLIEPAFNPLTEKPL